MPVAAAIPAITALAPLIGGVAMAGATIFSGINSANAAKSAAATQAQSASAAQALQAKQFEETRTDLAPFKQQGMDASGALSDLYGFGGKGAAFSQDSLKGFLASPEYLTGYNQGIKGVQSSAASRGLLQSPAAMEGIYKFGSDYTSGQINNYIGNLMKMSGQGESAAAQTGSFGAASASAQGGYLTESGAARAAGTVGAANALTATTSNLVSLGGYLTPPGGGGYSPTPAGMSEASGMGMPIGANGMQAGPV